MRLSLPSGLAPANVVLGACAATLAVLAARCAALLWDLRAHQAASAETARVAVLAAGLLLAALLACAAFRLRPGTRTNVALAIGSAAAALYAGELALEIHGGDWRRQSEKLRLLERLRDAGGNPSPGIAPAFFLSQRRPGAPPWLMADGMPTLPLAGIARRTVVSCRESGEWLVYDGDEHGFHNPPGLWASPLALAFVGDSFVYGSCVPTDANMVAVARRSVPATLNLGMPGSGPLVSLAQIREYLPSLRPRVVVWGHFSGNDLLDLRSEMQHPILRRYLEPRFSQRLIERQPAIDAALDDYATRQLEPVLARRARPWPSVRDVLVLRDVRKAAGFSFAAPYRLAPTDEEQAVFGQLLRQARDEVASWGGRLVFAYLPAWDAAPRQLGEGESLRSRQRVGTRTRLIVREAGIPLIDVAERFAAEADPTALYACPGCHYSPRGYALAAETILLALAGDAR